MRTIGLIGTGNMGGALACSAARVAENRLLLANRHPEKAEALSARVGGTVTDNLQAAREADYLLLGVKPKMVAGVLEEILPVLRQREVCPVLVSMASGVSVAEIRRLTEALCPVIRILPNIPVAVGEGVIFYTTGPETGTEQLQGFLDAFRCSGTFVPLEESLFDAGSAIAGCGGAFTAQYLEGLADGGVACGLPRKMAYELAERMVLGSARWLLESGKVPAELKDAVCSPGGTSIRGVRAGELGGLRSAAMEAVIAAYGGLDEL
ncbi:MAG: pyrroline-5-carboxylate reductase [Oscillospiraceae bacterium]|nr:pyrroline-5-carboxylate reductase [Oscillospiraceae bacterium]